MRTATKILGLWFISFFWSSCKEGSKFDSQAQSAQAQDIQATNETSNKEAEAAQQQALEPIAIGGAYLSCRYQVVDSNNEVWCRLEENQQPILVKAVATLENWVFTQNTAPYDAQAFALDPSTGWQWAIKIPENSLIDISLDIFLDGIRYHFDARVSTLPPDDDSSDETEALQPLQLKRYSYGSTASFVVDNNPFSLTAPEICLTLGALTKPDPTLPNLRFFMKAKSFTFPFKITQDSSLTVIVDQICGQTLPIHYAELHGVGVDIRAAIAVDAKKVLVTKGRTLPPGDYEVVVHYVPRSSADLESPESFAFGKVILESSSELIPGRAYTSNR